MKRLRWSYLALGLFYAAMLVGVQFHAHSVEQDLLTAHCKSCQISQTVYDEVKAGDLQFSQPVLHCQVEASLALAIHELQEIHSSRAPPLS
jgi:hypothetical protein